MWKPKALVIGPGAIKGLNVIGFLLACENNGQLTELQFFCGVSIGAVICLMMLVGYTVQEIAYQATTFDLFTNISAFDIPRIIQSCGVFPHEIVRQRLQTIVKDKYGSIPTLEQLYSSTGKTLICVTTNLTTEEGEYWSHSTHANVSCIDAVIASLNIPFVFYQLHINNNIYADGAIANPYPVNYLDDGETPILGIYMRGAKKREERTTSYTVFEFIGKLVHCVIDQRRQEIIAQSSDQCRHIELCCETSDTLGINMAAGDRTRMILEGFEIGNKFVVNSVSNCGRTSPLKYINRDIKE
jgi:predicted acylesterase/phospholipase RssA